MAQRQRAAAPEPRAPAMAAMNLVNTGSRSSTGSDTTAAAATAPPPAAPAAAMQSIRH